uniref:Uncharacterized protein n=1 Tax=Ananas comosus var. bracteatus TaxID=296719 RepID=A0A6V7Q6G3_ANACO|nr:unnamed protein product [Ananas comosus var. bracteatus]
MEAAAAAEPVRSSPPPPQRPHGRRSRGGGGGEAEEQAVLEQCQRTLEMLKNADLEPDPDAGDEIGSKGSAGEEEEEEEEEEEVRLRTLSSVDYETDEIEFSAYGEHDTAENIAGIWQMVPSPSTGRRSSPQETGTFSLLMREAAEELSRFIAAGKLHCKIDKVSDILETNRPDARNAFYRATIKQGDFFHLIWC